MKTIASLGVAAILLSTFATFAAAATGNPASAYCLSRGGKVEITTGTNGGERGLCVLPDGTRIDQWVYFRNTHRTK